MVDLLDANVLLALVWPSHLLHQQAHAWFGSQRDQNWATAPLTESAFVRLSSNPAFSPSAVTPQAALHLLQALRAQPGHRFLEDATTLVESPFSQLLTGHRQVTDAHLLALAHQHGARLVTFDRGLRNLIPSALDSGSLLLVLAP